MATCKSTWASLPKPNVCHLSDIMSEQLIDQLTSDTTNNLDSIDSNNDVSKPESVVNHDTNEIDDLLLAQILQHEYDLEYDDMISAQEKNLNRGSKVKISLANFRSIDPWVRKQELNAAKNHFLDEDCLDDSSCSDDDQIIDKELKTSIGRVENTLPSSLPKLQELKKVMVTKHDSEVCGRKNMGKFMTAPPGIDTGDCDGHGIKFGNPVYNSLKRHCIEVDKRRQRLHEKKEKSTAEQAIDTKTRLLLYKMINRDLLSSVSGCVSSGKEACVFHAMGGQTQDVARPVPAECALKVYKTVLTDFRNRERYIRNDYKFGSILKPSSSSKKLIKLWTEKETRNLIRMKRFGIKVPAVVTLQKHVLVMEFIGKDGVPALKLKDAPLSYAELEMAYSQITQAMKTMYQECRLVHADLSEYNILWHDGQCFFIDVGQSVEPIHPLALEFLYRDCNNITNFFDKKGVVGIHKAEKLFNQVTGLNLKGQGDSFLSQIQVYTKSDEYKALVHVRTEEDTSNASFDYLMDKILASKGEPKCLPTNEIGSDDPKPFPSGGAPVDETGYNIVKDRNKKKNKVGFHPSISLEGSIRGEEQIIEIASDRIDSMALVENDDSDSSSSFVKLDLE